MAFDTLNNTFKLGSQDVTIYRGSELLYPITPLILSINVASNGETIDMLTNDANTVGLIRIDWGDGTVDSNYSHTYTNSGVYDVKILVKKTNFLPSATRAKVLELKQWGTYLNRINFNLCTNMVMSATEIPNLDKYSALFSRCTSFVGNSSVNDYNIQTVNTINGMFQYSSFNQPLNNWDVSNIINMDTLFFLTPFNQDISMWNTGNVTTMFSMFSNANSFNQDISNWDYSSVTNLTNFMAGKSTANYNSSFYDNLLNKWALAPALGGLQNGDNSASYNISMGGIQYTAAGATARALIIAKGWNVIDGGLTI